MNFTEWREKIQEIHNLFVSDKINKLNAECQLRRLGETWEQSSKFIQSWETERTMKEFTLTE